MNIRPIDEKSEIGMTLDEFKSKFEKGELEASIYSAKIDGKNGFVMIGDNGFSTIKPTHSGWNEVNEYDFIDGIWIFSQTYQRD